MKVLDLLGKVQGSAKDAFDRYKRLVFCFSIVIWKHRGDSQKKSTETWNGLEQMKFFQFKKGKCCNQIYVQTALARPSCHDVESSVVHILENVCI